MTKRCPEGKVLFKGKCVEEEYDDTVKRLAKESRIYYERINIIPDKDDIINDVINALAEDEGVTAKDINQKDVEMILGYSDEDEDEDESPLSKEEREEYAYRNDPRRR